MQFRRLKASLLFGSACLLLLSAIADEPLRDFGFQPLEIYEFKNGAARLIVQDINGDGLDDVLFSNNHVSRIEILIRKPDTEVLDHLPELEERFEDKGMIVDQQVTVLRVDDMNGDGRPDLLTFGKEIGLNLRYQKEDHSFAEPMRIFVKDLGTVRTIQTGDLNGDAQKDILVVRRQAADLLWNAEERPFQTKKTLTFSDDKCHYGDIIDINEDQLNDLVFHFSVTRNSMKVRLGKGNGGFGTEQPVDMPPKQYVKLLQNDGETPKLGVVLKNRLAFRLYGFTQAEQPALLAMQEAAPGRIGLEGANKKSESPWLAADYNNDGFDDLLVAAPELSRLHLYLGSTEGLAPEPKHIDTLSAVSSMSKLANGDILVISKKEKIAAMHSAENLNQFPKILKTPGTLLAGCAVANRDESWFNCKNEDGKLELIQHQKAGKEVSIYALELENEPIDLMAFSMPDERTGLICFMPYDTPRMYLFGQNELTELTSESFRALSQQLKPANIRTSTPGDGSVLIISQGPIARRFEWQGERYVVTRQFNPENPRGELVASTSYTLTDGSEGILFYDRNSGDLIRFDNNSEEWGKISIPDANPTIFNLVQLKNSERDAIVLLDRTGLNEILGNGSRLSITSEAEYVSPSEKPMLAYAKAVNIGQPPRPMIALIDPANRSVELVSEQENSLKTELVFEVFLTSDFAMTSKSRGAEPHDLESGDINGDGIGDLVLLSQDKLLIYLGE